MGTTADKLEYLFITKEQIKQAIIAKGVEVSDSDTFRSYAEKIGLISGGGAGGGNFEKYHIDQEIDENGHTTLHIVDITDQTTNNYMVGQVINGNHTTLYIVDL